MLIPNVGDWVSCYEIYLSHGKVIHVDEQKGSFTAKFFTEFDNAEEYGGTSTEELPLSRIEEVIKDPARIESNEKQLRRDPELYKEIMGEDLPSW